MTDRERAELPADLYRALLEREARVEALLEQLLERDRARDSSVSTTPQQPAQTLPGPVRLTAREAQIVRLLVVGHTNRQIGLHLQLGAGTVRNYLSRIFKKLGATSRTQAAVRAVELGLTGPDGGSVDT